MQILTSSQIKWATAIVHSAISHPGIGDADHQARAADIALAVALAESGLRMYANGWNPQSLRLPHEAIGWDHGSVGLFQQQVGGQPHSTANWGTTQQCMDAHWSAHRFLRELTKFHWTEVPNWVSAQHVQRSADESGNIYRRQDQLAIATRKRLWKAAG